MKKVNRLFALAVAGLLAVSVAGCGSSSSKSSSGGEQPEMETRKVEQPADSAGEEKTTSTEKAPDGAKEKEEVKEAFSVKIDKAELGQDYKEEPVVIFTITFTNDSSDEAEAYMTDCHAEVFQNGVECEMAFMSGLEGSSSTKVKKGGSTTFQQAYMIADTSPVEIEIKKLFAWDDVVLASGKFELE